MTSQELIISELKTAKPVLIKDVLLICPGTWNEVEYGGEELKKAFENTDWENKSNTHLYLDHQDTQKRGVGNWAGFVKNIRLVANDLYGDLEIWNLEMATYLKAAKAKFGISATLKGFYNEKSNRMENFKYESFSIVTEPACAPAYINLSEKEKKLGVGQKRVSATLGRLDLEDNNSNSIQLQGGIENKMPEEKKKLEEEEAKEEAESKSEEASAEEEKEELSLKGVKELSGKVDLLAEKLDKLLSAFQKNLQEDEPEEEKAEESEEEESKEEAAEESEAEAEAEESESEEKEDELAAVKKELAAIKAKVLAPARKTLSATGASSKDANVGMLEFLKART